jgi:teichoic acid transport system ATP-binding protein
MDQPMRTYSSGMKARVGFAISASLDPEILVVDEALSVGDKAFREKCDAKIKEIMAKENVTVIFVTHSSNSARSVCTRGIVLEKGTMTFDGPIDEAIAYYEGPPAAAAQA